MRLIVKKVTIGTLRSTFLETTQVEGMDVVREIRTKGASISEGVPGSLVHHTS